MLSTSVRTTAHRRAIDIKHTLSYSDPGVLPSDLAQRAQVYQWLYFTATELEQPLWRIARNTTIYPENRRQPGDVVLAGEDFASMALVLERHMGRRLSQLARLF